MIRRLYNMVLIPSVIRLEMNNVIKTKGTDIRTSAVTKGELCGISLNTVCSGLKEPFILSAIPCLIFRQIFSAQIPKVNASERLIKPEIKKSGTPALIIKSATMNNVTPNNARAPFTVLYRRLWKNPGTSTAKKAGKEYTNINKNSGIWLNTPL